MTDITRVIKDILLVLTPIIVAYLSYRSNKKSRKELQNELDVRLKEKDKETSQLLMKMSTELENQKQLFSWQNSMPFTNKYMELIGEERQGNVSSLSTLIPQLRNYIERPDIDIEELNNIKIMLKKIKLPFNEDTLYPYEVPYLIDFNSLLKRIDVLISEKNCS